MLTRPHSYIDNLCVPFRHLCFATKLAWLQGWCWRLGGAETLLPEWLHSTSRWLHQLAKSTSPLPRFCGCLLCRWLESLTHGKSVPQFLQALAQLTAHLLSPHQCDHQCDKQADNHTDEDRLPETTHLYTSCSASLMTSLFFLLLDIPLESPHHLSVERPLLFLG